KALISRLGDLQEQLGRHDVALATHQRALEIDPMWRPSLRFVSQHLRTEGQFVASAGGMAQLAGELPGDAGSDLPTVIRERQQAATQLAELVATLDDQQLDALRDLVRPVLERAALGQTIAIDGPPADRIEPRPVDGPIQAALARLRGEPVPRASSGRDESTHSGRMDGGVKAAQSLRDAAARARKDGKLDEAFATLETLNHAIPGDRGVLRELVELATELDDFEAAATHLRALAELAAGARRGDVLLELADLCYDRLDDAERGRVAMREAAEAFGPSRRREATLRMLGSEASTHLAWDVAATALAAIAVDKRSTADVVALATALARGGRDAEALASMDEASALLPDAKLPDELRELATQLRAEVQRKAALARDLEQRALAAAHPEATALREEAKDLRDAIGVPSEDYDNVSIVVTGSPSEQADAIDFAAAAADRELLLGAWRRLPDDTSLLLAVLAHFGDREPTLRREILEEAARQSKGRAQAIALSALGEMARATREPVKAASLWSRAHAADPELANVWMPLADALAAADDTIAARELYERVAGSAEYADDRRQWAQTRAEALGRDDSIVSGEISHKLPGIARAQQRADEGDLAGAIAAAEQIATNQSDDLPGFAADLGALELLERLYLQADDVTASSEAIGRQLAVVQELPARALLWRRRARLYRNTPGRDAEVYRCLKEAHACAPADPEVAYQLRTAAMVKSEWALAASLLYREIAAAPTPRDRGALHLELALIYDEKLADPAQAQVNYEQALAFDPTVPAAKLPLARRYEAQGRMLDAARLYDEAAPVARPIDRAEITLAAARCRAAAIEAAPDDDLATKLECAEAAGDLEAARDLALQLWRSEPGHATAFRTLAVSHHGARADLARRGAARRRARPARSGGPRVRPRADRGSRPRRGARRAGRPGVSPGRLPDRRPDLPRPRPRRVVARRRRARAPALDHRRAPPPRRRGAPARASGHGGRTRTARLRDARAGPRDAARRSRDRDRRRARGVRARSAGRSRGPARRALRARRAAARERRSRARADAPRSHHPRLPARRPRPRGARRHRDGARRLGERDPLPLPARPARTIAAGARRAAVPARRDRARPPPRRRSCGRRVPPRLGPRPDPRPDAAEAARRLLAWG
ncbi:MAG: hypothetical protein NT062_25775, partial [Proteobacteria bacterium]|nr:hypothetical protein [Pseudomonadota bacterium]